ncbi:MAG: ComF family protein [Bacteroides sp.]|nr:ComF family protein [Bacteroides sp.]
MKTWIQSFFNLLFPPCCIVCQRVVNNSQETLCLKCQINLPRTHFHLQPENPIEKSFWGKFPVEKATSFFYYRPGSDFKELLHRLKYKGEKESGCFMGRLIATELTGSGFFDGIHMIVPVPLHPSKLKRRGYNQSEWIAKGIAEVTGLPIATNWIVRLKNTETQTRKSRSDRWENVEDIFALQNASEKLEGKHILLIDDVLTTGATLTACASVFNEVKDIRISVLTMAVAQL